VINYIFIFVNKTSTNFAILSELGRIPFALDCFTSVFKDWYRLDSSTIFLLKSAYIENKYLHSQGCDTWYSGLQRLFKIFDNTTGIHNMLALLSKKLVEESK
jgi:hypothetical protein